MSVSAYCPRILALANIEKTVCILEISLNPFVLKDCHIYVSYSVTYSHSQGMSHIRVIFKQACRLSVPYVDLHSNIGWDAKTMKLAQLGPHFSKPMGAGDPISQRVSANPIFKECYIFSNPRNITHSFVLIKYHVV